MKQVLGVEVLIDAFGLGSPLSSHFRQGSAT
jgi:hypothetical protein